MALPRTLAALLGLFSMAYAYTGDGTAYSGDGEKDKTGFNACEYGDLGSHWEKWYAAMPAGCGSQGWESNKCGKCIKARGLDAGAPGGWVVVKVVDQCASCTCGDVDFSTRGLQAVTGFSWDRKKVEWEWTECSESASKSSSSNDDESVSASSASSDDSSDSEEESKKSKKKSKKCKKGYYKKNGKCKKKKSSDRKLLSEVEE